MNRFRNPRLTTRNWEALAELDEDAMPKFEKVRTHHDEVSDESSTSKPRRARQDFSRSRSN